MIRRPWQSGRSLVARLVLALAAALLAVSPAAAQSILRDAETEAFLRDLANPLMDAAKLDRRSVHIHLVGDPSINAFAGGGQNVFLHSGLLQAADNVNQVQGVVAHELGHVAGGHNVRSGEIAGAAGSISLLSLLLAGAAMAAGAGDAGMAILGAGQAAAQNSYLSFSREQESRTDQAGAQYLAAAGISGKGSIDFFKKLQGQEYRLAIPQDYSYARTHPLSGDRINALQNLYEVRPEYNKPVDPVLEARFQRIKGKLVGYVEEPQRTFQLYPESDQSEGARLARAYAWHKSAYPDAAAREVDRLIASKPGDPYFLELKGQILLESGRGAEAIPVLRKAVAASKGEPLIAVLLGHALVSTEKPAEFAEAKPLLKSALARDRDNPFAWYQLGIIYDREGDRARAALASAERYNLQGNAKGAAANAALARGGLPKGTPDWLRADDIAMVSADALAKEKKRRRL